jgi:biotin carboxylase
MSPKRLILLAAAASYRSGDFEKAARRLGIDVVLGMDVPAPLAHVYRCPLPLDYLDVKRSTRAILKYVEQNPVQAILAADDSATELAAEASKALGLQHNAPRAAEAAHDTYPLRQLFAAAGVASPAFRLYPLDGYPAQMARAIEAPAPGPARPSHAGSSLQYPVVLKPRFLSGSRGVIRADDPEAFVAALARIRPIIHKTGGDDFLVEAFIPGFEVALEGLLDDGRLNVLALFDKPDPLDGPFFEETLYVTPSRLPEPTRQAIVACAARAAAALGLRQGPVHAELRVDQGAPWMVEVAGRSIGGLCSRTLRFGTDMSLEELILRQAFGMPVESTRREDRAGGVMMLPIPEAGIFKGCAGIEAAGAVPGIESIEITARPNYPIYPLPEGESYLGFIFARGPAPEAVEAALREAHRQLKFDIEKVIPVSG